MANVILTVLLCFILTGVHVANGAKILGIFTMPTRSHLIICESLMVGLSERGHEVTMITPYKMKKPLKNYREIVQVGLEEKLFEILPSNMFKANTKSVLNMILSVGDAGNALMNYTINYPEVQKLLKSNEKFDMVIVEIFMNYAVLGFAEHFDAIPVALTTGAIHPWVNGLVGNENHPAYQPGMMSNCGPKMNYVERVKNTLMHIMGDLAYRLMIHSQRKIYEQGFQHLRADPLPDFDDVLKNVSLVLLNTHHVFGAPRPNVPNMIDVAGIHISEGQPLPADIKQFLDSAKDGVIYFSMGSTLRSTDLLEEQREAFLKTFGKLKQKVLWKWEDPTLKNQPVNVKIGPWMPQQSILAHPHVKCFMTHGGLLSSVEALHYGVPVIGIPVFADQFHNMATAVNAGYGIAVNLKDISEEALTIAINRIFSDPSYQDNVAHLSSIFRDEPQTPLERAIYNVEYVLRHKGAPFLRSPSLHLNKIQIMLLDVAAGLIAAVLMIIAIAYFVIKKIFCKKSSTKNKTD